ncbi:hypothetical protein [Wenxinia saemankumensis]|uniref:Transmembrane protein n=1 Tax=Wenxinia saemankumensis TaxID=1447782 RepID=A0A1M6HBN0_9RHOB|nr:hypothetical protein [Wenxinia saemankumensis]SHJ19595.1 hypothetical protein SAMN05444417_3141 [Wenxinia saemankumensis]
MAEKGQLSREFAEEQSSLWRIAFAPTVWAVHFVACYATAAVACAKFPEAELAHVGVWRVAISAGTLVALALIAWIGWRAWRHWDYLDDHDYSHGRDDNESRHEFLGHAGFLLAVVSFIGVLATWLPAFLIEGCT